MTASQKRLGIFGGAFDPPHNAHLALAHAALSQLNLDKLLVIPTGVAPHKTRTLSPAMHRLNMTRLAFASVAGVQVDERELKRVGPSYTIDTLRELRQQYAQEQLFLILGADQWASFTQWQQWQDIAQIAMIYVAQRQDSTGTYSGFSLNHEPRLAFEPLHIEPTALNSTHIRQQVAQGVSIAAAVPPVVASYISQHRLYNNP